MLPSTMVRLPTRIKSFSSLTGVSCSGCIAPVSSRITQSVTRQRRDSSSKPSSSAPPSGNASNPVTASPDTPSPRKRGSFSKSASRLKAKDNASGTSNSGEISLADSKEEAFAIPSVPSTQHLHLQDVHLASLFAFHRPISVQHSLPQSISNKKFGQIFTPRPQQPKQYNDVITTISTTVSNILKDLERNQDGKNVTRVVVSDSTANANSFEKNAKEPNYVAQDGTPVFIDIDALVRNLPPFVAPPVPKKVPSRKSRTRVSKVAKMDEFFTPSSVDMVDVYESGEPVAIERIPTQPFLDRMRIRQLGFLERRRDILHAISVRRQRKLKMKKHKYKKLMKRTRNLRRRQDRL